MIIKNNKTTSALYKGTKEIQKRYKGTLVVYEAFKRLIASGVPPITLQKCKGVDLLDYKIYGNSVQEGDNLFDKDKLEYEKGYYNDSGVLQSSDLTGHTVMKIPVKPNTTYILDGNYNVPEQGTWRLTRIYYKTQENEWISRSSEIKVKTFEFTTPSNCYYIDFQIGLVQTETPFDFNNITMKKITPTPDAPIEIESVGDKTKNLFDMNGEIIQKYQTDISIEGDTIIATSTGTGNYFNAKIKIPDIEVGTTVTLSVEEITASNTNVARLFLAYYEVSTNTTTTFKNLDSAGVITVTIPEKTSDTQELCLLLYSNVNGTNDVGYYCTYKNIQLEIGNTATEYEPYGYKIPVKVSGKNLFKFDSSKTKAYNSSSYEFLENGIKATGILNEQYPNGYHSGYVNLHTSNPIKAGTYIVSWKHVFETEITLPNRPKVNMYGYDSDDNRIVALNVFGTYDKEKQRFVFPLDLTSDIARFYVEVLLYGTTCTIIDTQIEKGTSPTEYEPYIDPITTNIYLKEPLRKIKEHTDYIDFEKGQVIRKIKEHIFTGNEVLTLRSSQPTDGTAVICSDIISHFRYYEVLFCSRYPTYLDYAYSSKTNTCLFVNTNIDSRFHFAVEGVGKTVDEVQSILKNWYDIGQPMKLIYVPLETIDPETIELPNIPTIKGTTIIEVDTNILPSNMDVKYYGKE